MLLTQTVLRTQRLGVGGVIAAPADANAVVVGGRGTILRWVNSGQSWGGVTSGTTANLNRVTYATGTFQNSIQLGTGLDANAQFAFADATRSVSCIPASVVSEQFVFKGRISKLPPIAPSPREARAGRGVIQPLNGPLLPPREERGSTSRQQGQCQDAPVFKQGQNLRFTPADPLLASACIH